MKIIGLTGGIGSGKSTIAKLFAALGVAVYDADAEAKKLTNSSKVIRKKLIDLLGPLAYNGTTINRKYVAEEIFSNSELLAATNAIIHPKVSLHFKKWLKKQTGMYCIKEAAILFENGGYKKCDKVILVTAPKAMRIARVIERDATTRKAVLERMANQWDDEIKIKLADYIIDNQDIKTLPRSVASLHHSINQLQ